MSFRILTFTSCAYLDVLPKYKAECAQLALARGRYSESGREVKVSESILNALGLLHSCECWHEQLVLPSV